MARLLLLTCLAHLAACSSSEPTSIAATFVLTPGRELDAFTREPVPVDLTLHRLGDDGTTSELRSVAWDGGALDLGDLPVDDTASFEARALDADGNVILRGRSTVLHLAGLGGYELPMFMGRVNESSRPLGGMPLSSMSPQLGIIAGRFLVAAGGADTVDMDGASIPASTVSTYDLGLWSGTSLAPELPRVPVTMAVVQARHALLIDAEGGSWFDFQTYEQAEVEPPPGMAFSDVIGGAVLTDEDGNAYVVGPARTAGEPSTTVLKVLADKTMEAVHLEQSRFGAAATWMAGRGLIVSGGSTEGPGIEVLAQGSAHVAALDYPAEPAKGAALAQVNDRLVAQVGGVLEGGLVSPTKLFDISCNDACQPQIPETEPVALMNATGYAAGKGIVVAGTSADSGETQVVLVTGLPDSPVVSPVPLREPRKGASTWKIHGDMVAVVGGARAAEPVFTIEIVVPEGSSP